MCASRAARASLGFWSGCSFLNRTAGAHTASLSPFAPLSATGTVAVAHCATVHSCGTVAVLLAPGTQSIVWAKAGLGSDSGVGVPVRVRFRVWGQGALRCPRMLTCSAYAARRCAVPPCAMMAWCRAPLVAWPTWEQDRREWPLRAHCENGVPSTMSMGCSSPYAWGESTMHVMGCSSPCIANLLHCMPPQPCHLLGPASRHAPHSHQASPPRPPLFWCTYSGHQAAHITQHGAVKQPAKC